MQISLRVGRQNRPWMGFQLEFTRRGNLQSEYITLLLSSSCLNDTINQLLTLYFLWKVVAYDFGIKHNILRRLSSYGCQITVVPSTFPASEAVKMNPDGILFSNGPGDPSAVPYAVETVKELLGKAPVYGICMGHQLLGQALGGTTFKMKFGHHGGNHPVRNNRTGQVEISAQVCSKVFQLFCLIAHWISLDYKHAYNWGFIVLSLNIQNYNVIFGRTITMRLTLRHYLEAWKWHMWISMMEAVRVYLTRRWMSCLSSTILKPPLDLTTLITVTYLSFVSQTLVKVACWKTKGN